jgi:predicted transposase YbfD/YdcC
MDPFTLFALANGAVSAVKAGCKLYKDIKGAAGEVKDVLKDLDEQFKKLHPPEKPATVEQKKQFIEEKERIKKLNQSDPGDAYDQIAEHLSVYFENYAKCIAIFEQEEARAQEVYDGESSIGKRALQRVVMRKKLEQMGVELRELLVYQSPPELGALYSDVSEMMEKITKEQTAAIAKKMKQEQLDAIRRKKRLQRLRIEIAWGISVLVMVATISISFAMLVEDRIKKYPHLGDGWIPKTEEQRRIDALPKQYIGR